MRNKTKSKLRKEKKKDIKCQQEQNSNRNERKNESDDALILIQPLLHNYKLNEIDILYTEPWKS